MSDADAQLTFFLFPEFDVDITGGGEDDLVAEGGEQAVDGGGVVGLDPFGEAGEVVIGEGQCGADGNITVELEAFQLRGQVLGGEVNFG